MIEEQIDEIVTTQAEDDTAWEKPILVCRTVPTTMSLPPELATRAAFFARLHKVSSVEDWLRSIIRNGLTLKKRPLPG